MPYYSPDLIEEVRARNNIVDVISGYVHLKKAGSAYVGLCPFHNEKTPSFSVSASKQIYHCFGCGAGGNVISFLMEYERFTFQEAVEDLAQRAGIELPKQEYSAADKHRQDVRSQIMDINKAAAKYYYVLLRGERGRRALAYFQDRGLGKETMQKFGLGYSDKYNDALYRFLKQAGYSDGIIKESGLAMIDERGAFDKFRNRAMFPIMNVQNKVIGFGGRVMGEGEPKYLNSPETPVFDKSRNLYGLNIARSSKRQGLLLCEGYMDVIALHQAGFDNAVASLGTAFTPGHANFLKRYTKDVYLSFDSDGAGQRAILRAIPILREAGISPKIVNMEPYKDPDEFIKALGSAAYEERIKQSENFFFFEVRMAQQKYDLNDPEEKTRFFHETAQLLLQFDEEIERGNYIEAVARKYAVSQENLRKYVMQQGMKMDASRPRAVLKQGGNRQKKAEDGTKRAQKLLLAWFLEHEGLYGQLKDYISPRDFTGDIYRKVAEVLFEQLEEGQVSPAKIVGMFEAGEDQREVAELFHTKIQLETKEDRQKAIHDILIKLKQGSIASVSKEMAPADMEALQQLIQAKKQLESLEKLHISID